jgi:hypothetical protein
VVRTRHVDDDLVEPAVVHHHNSLSVLVHAPERPKAAVTAESVPRARRVGLTGRSGRPPVGVRLEVRIGRSPALRQSIPLLLADGGRPPAHREGTAAHLGGHGRAGVVGGSASPPSWSSPDEVARTRIARLFVIDDRSGQVPDEATPDQQGELVRGRSMPGSRLDGSNPAGDVVE